jgi:hypothetical protein
MISIGIGLTSPAVRWRGGGAPSLPLAPVGARIVFGGHSKVSIVSARYICAFAYWTITKLGGLARLALGGDQGIAGNTIAQYDARLQYTTEQVGDITFILIVHNSLNLGHVTVNAQLDALKAELEAANPTKYLIFATEPPSAAIPPTDSDLLLVNAHIAAYDGTNGGFTKYCDFFTGFDYATMTYSASGDVNIHPNQVGAAFLAGRAQAVIAPLIPATPIETILDDITATGDHGADTCPPETHNMTFTTGGVKAGTGSANITGDVADKFTLTNNTTCNIACSIETIGSYNRQILDITGTGVTEGYIEFRTTSAAGARAPINAVVGDVTESLWGHSLSQTDGASAPVGLLQHGAVLPTSLAGYSLGQYTSAESRVSGAQAFAMLNHVARTYPKVAPAAGNNVNPTFGVRVSGNVNTRLILWKPIVRKTELVAYAAPLYLGSDGIMGTDGATQTDSEVAFRGSLTNGVAAAFQSGAWSGGGITYGNMRVYQGGTAGATGIGTGTLIATIPRASNAWTWTAAVTAAQSYHCEVDVSNSFGTGTARSDTKVAV